jgi:hypothetical protein
MKTLCVALLFAFSLVSLLASARADALAQPRIERMAQPQPLVPDDGKKGGGEDDKKGGGEDDEEDEEEYRALRQRAALELVDPGALEYTLKLRVAAQVVR